MWAAVSLTLSVTFSLDFDDEVFLFSGKWRTYVLLMRCYRMGVFIHLFCIFPLMPLLDIEDAYGVTGKLKLTCELIQCIFRDFMREAIRHMCLRVCWVKSLVACRSRKLPSGFQLNLLQTLVCPEGPALMENHQCHTIEALLLTAVSISPIKLP